MGLPPIREVVDRGETSGEMVRLLIRGADGAAEADGVSCSGHCRHDGQRLVDRPLGARADGMGEVFGPQVHVIAPEYVGDEDAMKLAALEALSE